jgi:hypothetical protein
MLTPAAADLWTTTSTFALPGGVRLPLRTTVVKLPTGELVVHAPAVIDEALAAEVAALGPVKHVVAPNMQHHLYVEAWMRRFPGASLWGAPGLETKRRDLSWAGRADDTGVPWAGALEAVALAGCPKLNEVVFLHRASRTLLCTDLVFNVRRPDNLPTKLVLSVMGTSGRFAMSRAWKLFARDRRAFGESLARVLAWDFVRVIPAHGDVLEDDAHAATGRALAGMRR